MSLFLPTSHGLIGHLRTTPRCGPVAISFLRPLDLPLECFLVAQSSIFVAHLWHLHPQFLATGTMGSGLMCDLSVLLDSYFELNQDTARANYGRTRPTVVVCSWKFYSHDRSLMHVCLTVASETESV